MTQTETSSAQDNSHPAKAEALKIPVLSLDEGYAYFEGRIVPMSEAKVSIATHALHYGTACFEGIRGYWNADHQQLYLLKLRDHYERMANSWNTLYQARAHLPGRLYSHLHVPDGELPRYQHGPECLHLVLEACQQ